MEAEDEVVVPRPDDDVPPEGERVAPPAPQHWLLRSLLLRGTGLVYVVAFATLALQGPGLLGPDGITPVEPYLRHLEAVVGDASAAFWRWPSVFWWSASDAALVGAGWLGVALGAAAMLGVAHGALFLVLWLLQLSILHVGQSWYGFGWEIQLAETGFLALVLAPWRSWHAFDPRAAPPRTTVWLWRWLVLRVMLGAGLIKVRGDPCWEELMCLVYHYETQPNPSPLSWLFHHAPRGVHQAGVLFNHLVELVAPLAALGPRPFRPAAGVLFVVFQGVLIASGNLAFLNWLTLVACLSCFDDRDLLRAVPPRWRPALEARLPAPVPGLLHARARTPSLARGLRGAVVAVVAWLSVEPVANLMSPFQAMNRSYDRLHLVNSYGAFGGVTRDRYEMVVEGTLDPLGPTTRWRAYAFPCKPGDPRRRPCLVTPYHLRLDWQMWFVPLGGDAEDHRWLLPFLGKLLAAEPVVLDLLADDPFDGARPRYLRVQRYRYRFTDPGEEGWWVREPAGTFVAPLSLDDPYFSGASLRGRSASRGGGTAPR